jgi:hypothetical protein
MQKRSIWILTGAFATFAVFCLTAGTTNFYSKLVVQNSATEPTCATATGDGDICAADAIEANGALDVGGATTLTGEISAVGGIDLADDADIDLGTGDDFLITFDATTQAPDSAFIGVGSESRQLVIAETADVGTDLTIAQQTNPTLNIHSADATTAGDYMLLYHDQTDGNITTGAGGLNFASNASTYDFTGDVTIDGAAGSLTFADGDESIVVGDNDSTALVVGATGALDILGIDSTDGAEGVAVGGKISVAGKAITESGATDTTLAITQTLNDTGAVDGSEDYTMIKGTLTVTDGDAWATTNLLDLVEGSTSRLKVSSQGGIESNGGAVAGGTYTITPTLGASKGWTSIQNDGTAASYAANTLSTSYFQNNALNTTSVVIGGGFAPAMDATGFDLGGTEGNITANDNFEIFGGTFHASGRPMTVGTDPAFQFCVSVTFTDVSGSDAFYCGWREASSVPSAIGSYTDFGAVGHISGNYGTIDEDGADDSGADTWADTENDTLCIFVSAAGVVTYTVDGATPTTPGAQTITDGQQVIPFCNLLHDADKAEDTIITSWVVSYTQP